MNLYTSRTFAVILLLSVLTPIHALNEQTSTDTVTLRTQPTAQMIKSVQDFDTILQENDCVLALIYNPSLISSDTAQRIAQDLLASLNTTIRIIIMNTNDIPSITKTCSFQSDACIVSFIKGVKEEQLDININAVME